MGKRKVVQTYEDTETATETVETEVPVTKEDVEHVYFCDDCGDPCDEHDLKSYRRGTRVFHFCGTCEARLKESSDAVAQRERTLVEIAEESMLVRVLISWKTYCLLSLFMALAMGNQSETGLGMGFLFFSFALLYQHGVFPKMRKDVRRLAEWLS